MSSQQEAIPEELQAIFREFFMQDGIVLQAETTMHDIAGWDSLTNISLMLMIQQTFAIRLSARDQHALNTVGDLAALLRSKRLADGLAPLQKHPVEA
jgi:acyl carrier protein